jgi:hypothetical protein
MTTARHLLLASVFLLGSSLALQALAQSDDDDTAPAVTAPSPPPSDLTIHHHGGGGDDDAPSHPWLSDRPSADQLLQSKATRGAGLALDHSALPGELPPTPEGGRALFSQPADSLAQERDPWDNTPK